MELHFTFKLSHRVPLPDGLYEWLIAYVISCTSHYIHQKWKYAGIPSAEYLGWSSLGASSWNSQTVCNTNPNRGFMMPTSFQTNPGRLLEYLGPCWKSDKIPNFCYIGIWNLLSMIFLFSPLFQLRKSNNWHCTTKVNNE